MDNINIVLAENIQNFRKKCGFTQEELAQKIGVTFQAVSKWENAKSAPDIMFLPIMADLFDCSIDQLFSRDFEMNNRNGLCDELPWEDDDVIRIFQAQGKKIIDFQEKSQTGNSWIEVRFPKNCNETTRQYFKVEVLGNMYCDASVNGDVVCQGNLECNSINGSVKCDCNVEVKGSVNGGCNCGCSIAVGGKVNGACQCGDSISAGGGINGSCNCGDNITCGGNLRGNIECGSKVSAGGDIEATTIRCESICCETLKCDIIDSNVTIK